MSTDTACTIDLMAFFEPDTRYSKPWLDADGQHAIATDGRALIVCDRKLWKGELLPRERPPDWRKIMQPFDGIVDWLPLPSYPECRECKGTAIRETDCLHCDGYGEHECSCGDSHDCGYCYGEGTVKSSCEKCTCAFGNRRIARSLANRLLTLPGIEWAVAKPSDFVFFRFSGGMGAVAPLSEK